jgi:ferredoxin
LRRKKWLKSELKSIISNIKGYKVFAPVQMDSVVLFAPVNEDDALALDRPNTKASVKNVFFPQTEPLFCYKRCGRNMSIDSVPLDAEKKVIFGVRPCDAASLQALDAVFSTEEYPDPYYMKRRENTTLIVFACNEPEPTCFCTSLEGGPWSREGADVFVYDTGDFLVAESITGKGDVVVDQIGGKDIPEVPANADSLKQTAGGSIRKIDIGDLPAKLQQMFDSPKWQAIAERCLGCGICSYLCPTCHCFDIQDQVGQEGGRRVRNWDSCMFPVFSLHASGHNPRTNGYQRIRQRVMHKLNYFSKNFGRIACVGCGRCIQSCPANIDMREVIEMLRAE